MRPSWIPLFALALLAGCTETPVPMEDASSPDTTTAPGGAQAFLELGNSSLPAIGFDAGAYNSTVTFTGDFPNPNTCFVEECPEQVLQFDLTPQVPADAPVDLTVAFEADNCIDAWLDIEDNGVARELHANDLNGELALRLVRSTSGTVTLVLRNCSTFAGDLGATSNPVAIEVRTVVRPTVLPTYVPVAVDLQAGDRLQAMGSGLEDLIVIPPGGSPIHHLGPFDFTVPADAPAGTYVVVAKGDAEAMLHGTAASMSALPIFFGYGEARAIPNGQELSWDFEVPGVPLVLWLVVRTHEGQAGITETSVMGNHDLSITQQGAELLRYQETGCTVPCRVSLPTGYSQTTYPSEYLSEAFKTGPMTASIRNDVMQGFDVHEGYAYVQP